MSVVDIDMSEFREFFGSVEKAAKGEFRKELELFLEELGYDFLRCVQDEFINRNKNTGYGQLLSSFTKDDENNIWRFSDGGLTIEIGSSVEYASYVNDGHRTFDPAETKHFTLSNGEAARFVPGYWQGNRFIYDPAADGGMVLKYHWVEGLHFWEAAVRAMERICPAALDRKLQEWLDNYFGG